MSVRWIGAQRDVLGGDVGAKISLRELGELPHLDALIFMLRAYATAITFHVLDKRDGLPHTPALHERATVRFRLERRVVEVLGFYSRRHRGMFTPGDSDLHMHFRTVETP